MFTQDNTQGYTDEQLAALNAELSLRLQGRDESEHEAIRKAFADEVASR